MMKRLHGQLCWVVFVVVGLVFWSLPGCGKGLPNAVPVSGTVTYQGQPLAGATVTFRNETAQDLAAGGLALGTTDSEGKFSLRSHLGPTEVVDGVVPGEYRVTVSKFIPPDGMSEQDYQQRLAEEEKIMQAEGVVPAEKQVPPKVELLPPEYSGSQNATLKATIPAGGDSGLKFDLQ